MNPNPPVQIVILGASGDLTSRKRVPARASLARSGADFSLVGFSRSPMTSEAFRAQRRSSMDGESRGAFEAMANRVHYVPGDVRRLEDIRALGAHLDELPGGSEAGRLFDLSLRPDLFVPALESLSEGGLLRQTEPGDPWRRLVAEKPFGHDRASAQALDRALRVRLREDQIYGID